MATQPTQVVQQQVGLAPEIAPYAQRLLGAAEGSMFQYQRDAQGNVVRDSSGMPVVTGFQPYQQYQGERFAQFSPLQQQSYAAAQNMQAAPELSEAAQFMRQGVQSALDTQYGGQNFSNQFAAPQPYTPGTISAQNVTGSQAQAARLGAAPRAQAAQMSGPSAVGFERVGAQQVGTPQMQAAQTGYAPNLRTYQMRPAERVTTQSFARPGSAEAFMSPYMQSVVERQQQGAQREADIQSQAQKAQFAQAGAFGGGRFGVQQAQSAAALARQKGDIQASGLQAAYQQAQQQFNQEQAARLQAQQANQQAGLTVGQQNLAAQLGVQQLGAQTGLQTSLANLNAQQQANVQNQAAQLQAQGMNAQQAMQAALANQQAGMQTGQFNAQQAYNTGLQNAQMQQQANLANQQMAGQFGLQQGQFGQAANLQNAQLQQQANLANQQAGLQAQGQTEAARQFGYGQQMQAAGLGAQYGQAAQQLGEQSRQFGAGLQLQGAQAGMAGAQQLGQIGQAGFNQGQQIASMQNQFGAQQQQQAQNILGAQYQDFLNAQNMPYRQMGFMSDVVRGVPLTQTGSTMYQAPPSTAATLAGAAAVGRGFGFFGAKGGAVKEYPAGLNELALYKIGQ